VVGELLQVEEHGPHQDPSREEEDGRGRKGERRRREMGLGTGD